MTEAEQEAAGCVIGRDYPPPIVDHATERRRAMERYRAVTGREVAQ
jgi:deoxyribodipyrimidine photo-lyase